MKKIILISLLCVCVCLNMSCENNELKVSTSSQKALELFNEGVSLAEKFYDVEAIKKFNDAINLDSSFVMAHYYKSRSYESLGNLAEAGKSIDEAKNYSGTKTMQEWMFVSAWDNILKNRYSDAIKIYKQILKNSPRNKHALFVSGKTYFLMGDYESDVKMMKKLVKIYPDYAPAFNQLGYAYNEMGEMDLALAAFSTYANLEPNEPNPHDSLGDMYRKMGEYRNAASEYKKAIEVKDDFYVSYQNLGLVHLCAGNYQEAENVFQDFLKKFPAHERQRDGYLDLTRCYTATGQYNKALESAEHAVQNSKTVFRKSAAITNKANIYILKGDYDSASKLLNASHTIYPDAIWALEGQGILALNKQDYSTALSQAEKMKIVIDKYGIETYNKNYFTLLGNLAMEQGFFDEAVMYFKDAMNYDEYDLISNRYHLAKAYYKKKELSTAIDMCNEILKLNENHPQTHLLLGEIYEVQNKRQQAKTEYDKFHKIWKNTDVSITKIVGLN